MSRIAIRFLGKRTGCPLNMATCSAELQFQEQQAYCTSKSSQVIKPIEKLRKSRPYIAALGNLYLV
jgi:hypothetical protein